MEHTNSKRKVDEITAPEDKENPTPNKKAKQQQSELTITKCEVTDTHIIVHLRPVDDAVEPATTIEPISYAFPTTSISDKVNMRRIQSWEAYTEGATTREIEQAHFRMKQDEFAVRFKWFIEKTTGLCTLPGLLERAKQHWTNIDHPHKHGWLGQAINLYAKCAGAPEPPCKREEVTSVEPHVVIPPEKTACSATPHRQLGGDSLPPMEMDNPFHFIAVLVCLVRGWWNTYFKESILFALGPQSSVPILLQYLAHEERCDGLRWYPRGGISVETVVADAIMVSLATRNYYDDAWAVELDSKLKDKYRGNITWDCY